MAAEQLLLPMAILASVAIASETCLTLSHLTFGGLGVSQPAYQRTREGFGVLLFWDALSYVFPASFAIAVGMVQFDQPQSWWLLWPTIVGFALHASYNILYNFFHHQVYRRFHEVEHATLYDDGKFVLGKRLLATFDAGTHLYGAWLVFHLIVAANPDLAFGSVMLGGFWYVLYINQLDRWMLPTDN